MRGELVKRVRVPATSSVATRSKGCVDAPTCACREESSDEERDQRRTVVYVRLGQ